MSLMKGNGAYAMTQCYSECFVKRLLFPLHMWHEYCGNVLWWNSSIFMILKLMKINKGFLFCGRSWCSALAMPDCRCCLLWLMQGRENHQPSEICEKEMQHKTCGKEMKQRQLILPHLYVVAGFTWPKFVESLARTVQYCEWHVPGVGPWMWAEESFVRPRSCFWK